MVQVQGGAKAARGRVPGECGALGERTRLARGSPPPRRSRWAV